MAQAHPQNRTLTLVRAGFRAVSRTSPELAARLSVPLMFRTKRRAPADWERELVARAKPFTIATRAGDIPAWSWGEGPVVLLVHGWNGRGTQLGAFVDPLVSLGHRVVAFDAPGHGSAAGSRASILDFADAIEAVVDAVRPVFGPARALIAHSMGGPASVIAMSRFDRRAPVEVERALRENPLPVERFVFIAPPVDVRDFVRGFAKQVDLAPESEFLLGRRIESLFDVRLADLAAPALARTLSGPLLVVHDRNDREVPLSRGRELAEAWPGAELVVTEGLGHTRILREPNVIARVSDFVIGMDERAA